MIHQLEERKYEAVSCEQFDNARKLKHAIDELIVGGQTIGALAAQKRAFADYQEYTEAKAKKTEMEETRDDLYRELRISELLDLPIPGPSQKLHSPGGDLPPPMRVKSYRRGSLNSLGKGSSDTDTSPARPKVDNRKPLPPPTDRKGNKPKRKRHDDSDDEG